MPNKSLSEEPLGFMRHDHRGCIANAVTAAEQHCVEEGLRFTPVRRRVLEMLLEQHQAMGAYDVLERLQSEGLGAQPPAAYRALDFLVSHGFAHRLERLNAFIACSFPGTDHVPAFLICTGCDRVAETVAMPAGTLLATARAADFTVERVLVEAEGTCAACRSVT